MGGQRHERVGIDHSSSRQRGWREVELIKSRNAATFDRRPPRRDVARPDVLTDEMPNVNSTSSSREEPAAPSEAPSPIDLSLLSELARRFVRSALARLDPPPDPSRSSSSMHSRGCDGRRALASEADAAQIPGPKTLVLDPAIAGSVGLVADVGMLKVGEASAYVQS